MLKFVPIDIKAHREVVIGFRKDSFKVSFGEDADFDEENYISWLRDKMKDYHEGFVLLEEAGRYMGQLELTIKEFEGENIGYVNLYYLIPEERGNGKGGVLHAYAKRFFENHNLREYHLRVSPENTAALSFYSKNGMEEAGREMNGKVVRMKGEL